MKRVPWWMWLLHPIVAWRARRDEKALIAFNQRQIDEHVRREYWGKKREAVKPDVDDKLDQMTPEERDEYYMNLGRNRKPGDPFYPVPQKDGSVFIGTMYGGESTDLTFVREVPKKDLPFVKAGDVIQGKLTQLNEYGDPLQPGDRSSWPSNEEERKRTSPSPSRRRRSRHRNRQQPPNTKPH